MARGSFGAYRLEIEDPEAARKAVMGVMKRLGYRAHRRGGAQGRFKIVGIRGSTVLALLMQLVPFMELTGFGSRVRATLSGGTSLNEGDSECRLAIRVIPIRETEAREETLFVTQSLGESMGDDMQARRSFRRLVEALAEGGVIRSLHTSLR